MGRRTPHPIVALVITATALGIAPSATADVLNVDQRLAQRHLHPAPLVPTTAPRSLRPLDTTLDVSSTRRRTAYAVAMRSSAVNSFISLSGGEYKTVKATLRDLRGVKVKSMRVRGHRGSLATKKSDRTLVWSEGGRIYELISVTPRTVSLKELLATADGLEPLIGTFSASDSIGNEGFVATTRHTYTADVDWTANCTAPNGTPAAQRAGRARVALQPLRGSDFSFDVAPNVVESDPPIQWQGTVSGTIGASGGSLTLQGTAVDAGDSCDTGPVSLALQPDR